MESQKPAITVIVPAYNTAKFIGEALGYIKNQTFKDYECVVVNDGSKDKTAQIAKNFIKKDKRFKLINHESNKGSSAARNTGFAVAKGKYVIFLDSDDIFDKKLLETLYVNATKYNSQITVCNFSEYKVKKQITLNKIINDKNIIIGRNFTLGELLAKNSNFEALSNIVCNKLYEKKYMSDERLLFNVKLRRAEDPEFNMRALILAERISYCPEE
ncbi:MAG: glycosyltransferase family 2 protein, partial [bacterium]